MRRGLSIARVVLVVLLAIAVALALGGCGTTQGTSSPSSPEAASATSTTAMAPTAASTSRAVSASASASSSGTQVSPSPAGLEVDPRLLEILPPEVDGVPLAPDPTTAGQIATDPSLAGFAQAINVALAIRSGTSTGDDLAIASVLRLRPGVFSEPWFQGYRESYDAAACAVAGGVQGKPSEVTIGGRTAHVGRCAGDARTYHVHLADPTLIVSVTSAGPRGFGGLVVAGLAE